MKSPLLAIIVATFVAMLSVSVAFCGAALVRTHALASSHEQPQTEELWANPTPPSSATLARGRTKFLNNCAHCHGIDARGDEGPDLHDVNVSDRYIRRIITHGIPHEMPAFSKKLSADDVAAVIAYVRSLEGKSSGE